MIMAHICKTSLYCARKHYFQCVVTSIRKLNYLKRNCQILLKKRSDLSDTRCLVRQNVFNSVGKYSTNQNDDEFLPEIDMSYYENLNTGSELKEKDIRSMLYPDSDDPIIRELKKCITIQDVMDIIEDKSDVMNHRHICQAILIFWDLQKSFNNQYVENLGRFDVDSGPEVMYKKYTQELISHKTFIHFLELLKPHIHVLNSEELTYAMLYLKKLGYTLDNPILQSMIKRGKCLISDNPDGWSLQSLERYTDAIRSREILNFAYLAIEPIPLIVKYLNNCKSADDFMFITECLYNIHIVVGTPLLETYKEKCFQLIDSGIITNDNIETVISVIHFLNLFHWSKRNAIDIIYLSKFLTPSIHKMDVNNIIGLHRVFQAHFEPASIVGHIKKKVTYLLEESKYDDRVKAYLKLPDLLYCQIMTSSTNNKVVLEKILTDLIQTTFSSNLLSIFNSLRCLKLADYSICDLYWKQVAIQLVNNDQFNNRLLQLCYKYMYFNYNIIGHYRSQYFEDAMLKKLYNLLENEDASFVTSKYSRILSFVIAYGLTRSISDVEIDRIETFVNKMEDHIHQINHLDYFILSRGIQLFNKQSYVSEMNSDKIYKLIIKINNILDKCSDQFSRANKCDLNDLNILCKSYINRKSIYETDHFHSLLYKYNFIDDSELSSRLIKQASYNFIMTNTYVPKFIHQVEDFVAGNEEIFGDVGQKILYMCYLSGLTPKNDKFYTTLINILNRDKDIMNGLTLLQYCVSLSYYGHLTDDLIKYVFSLEFLERLDSEIESCHSRKTYPKRLRLQMMILNRIVCLDYPQHEIPWFHQKYIEEFISYSNNRRSTFAQDVLNTLSNLTGNVETLYKPHFSPYGYKIDFCLQYNRNNQYYKQIVPEDKNSSKVAILLLYDKDYGKIFTADDCILKNLKSGFFMRRKNCSSQLRSRHLEQLGYEVVEISNAFWNSMYMAEPNAKMNYLRNKIRK